ncbi:uncharacterized protein sS8_3756 [Methylocaldum marinum]|uniref:Uncharacterized protein n=1 Tax=Methylocaldum marinum TaxID=1432792 RepID=A0A250KVJ1_9GAMM|nr:uncharacterized protein sS8_3756 [Methylocaldum marinum]
MVCLNCGATRHYHEIASAEVRLPQAETFADEALDAVAIGGVTDLSSGDCQPEARMIPAVGSRKHGQVLVCGLARLLENALEIGGGT